jgi:hypothetical protein
MFDPKVMSSLIRRLDSDVIESSGRDTNEAFPYRYWQSFRLPHWDFSVDISVDCKRVDEGFELSADIATSDGFVLAEFQTRHIAAVLSDHDKEVAIDTWVKSLYEFLQSHADIVVQKLKQHKDIESGR